MNCAPEAAAANASDIGGKPPPARVRRWLLPLILVVAGGGLLLAVGVVAVTIGAVMLWPSSGPAIADRWRLTNPAVGAEVTIEFRKDGSGVLVSPSMDAHFQYTLSRDDPPILEWRITQVEHKTKFARQPVRKSNIGANGDLTITVNDVVIINAVTARFRVTLLGDVLVLANVNGGPQFGLRRAG